MTDRDRFYQLLDCWMRIYCLQSHPIMSPQTFQWSQVDHIDDHTIHWFLRGLDNGLFEFRGKNFYWRDRKEKLPHFHSGKTELVPRPIEKLRLGDWYTLALATRLVEEFGWSPEAVIPERAGKIEFDLVVEPDGRMEIACEAKSNGKEYRKLIDYLHAHGRDVEGRDRRKSRDNAAKKLGGLYCHAPRLFWAFAGEGNSQVFRVRRSKNAVLLEEVGEAELRCPD